MIFFCFLLFFSKYLTFQLSRIFVFTCSSAECRKTQITNSAEHKKLPGCISGQLFFYFLNKKEEITLFILQENPAE